MGSYEMNYVENLDRDEDDTTMTASIEDENSLNAFEMALGRMSDTELLRTSKAYDDGKYSDQDGYVKEVLIAELAHRLRRNLGLDD